MDQKLILAALISKKFNPRKEVLFEEEPKFNPHSPPFNPSVSLPDGRQAGPLTKVMTRSGGIKGGLSKSPQGFQNEVKLISENNNRLRLFVKTSEDAILVLSDTYFPGWKVLIDGEEENIYRADYNLRAVFLGAGTHQVKFIYDPLSFKLGAIITFLGIIGCLVIGLAVRHRKH
jgi:hypothetical protein